MWRSATFVGAVAVLLSGCSTDLEAVASPTLVTTSTGVPAAPTSTVVATATSTTTGTATTIPTTTATTTVTTTATTTVTTTTAPEWPRRITFAFTGDTLPHSPLWRRAADNAAAAGTTGYDFGPMLAGLRPVLDAADLAVCHLETPIAPFGEAYSTNPFYGVPAEIADAIAAAGYERCSTASNHAADRGAPGIERTVDVLEQAGVAQSGMARRPAEIEPVVVDVDGIPITHLSYTWSYNGLSLPPGDEWRSALIDPDRILADAERARELGATVVVVSLHWGAEGVHEPTRFQREIAEAITEPGIIDLVVGHHAHVLQPIERVNGTWVVFGLGNVLSNLPTSSRWPAASQDAAVVTVGAIVAEDGTVAIETPIVDPTWVDKDAGWIVRLVDAELARDDLGDGQRARLEASRDRTAAVLGEFMRPVAPP